MNKNINKTNTEEENYDGLVSTILNYVTKNKMTLGQFLECSKVVEDFFLENAHLENACSKDGADSYKLVSMENLKDLINSDGYILIDLRAGEVKANNLKSGELNIKKGSE